MGFVRGIVKFVAAVLLFILIPLSILGIWSRMTLLETDQYVNAVAPLASDEAVQLQVRVSIMSFLDSLAEGSGGNATFTQQLIQRQYPTLRPAIEEGVVALLNSPVFQQIWETANRDAHQTLVLLLEGRAPTDDQGRVTLDLSTVYAELQAGLSANGISILDGINPSPDTLTMPLFQYDELSTAQDYVRLFDEFAIVIPVVAILVALLFVFISVSRSRAILWLAIISAISAGLLLLVVTMGRDVTANQLSPETARDAGEAIYTSVTRSLRSRLIQLGIGSLVVAVVFFFISRSVRPRRYY